MANFPALGYISTLAARGEKLIPTTFLHRAEMARAIGQHGIARMYAKAAQGENLAGLGINSGTGAELTALIGSLGAANWAPAIVQGATQLPPRAVVGTFSPDGIVAEEKLETFQSAPILLSNGVVQVLPSMLVAIICVSQEFLSLQNAPTLLQGELEKAITRGLDRIFYNRLAPGSAGGFGATSSALADLRELTGSVVSRTGQKLLLGCDVATAQRLAFLAPGGIEVFPMMNAIGPGEIKGLNVYPSDEIPAGTLIAVDPSGLAASIDEITVESSPSAAVNFDDSSQMPTALTSMFQSNSVALRISARFTCTPIGSEDVSSECTGCAWSEA